MPNDPKQLVFLGVLLLTGAFAGVGSLCSMQSVNVVTTVCAQPTAMHIVYSLPTQDTHGDYSDPDVNTEDCFAQPNSEN
jgi:hypothetical protein